MKKTIEEATKIAVELSEHLDAKEQAMFIAGFQTCFQYQSGQSEWISVEDALPKNEFGLLCNCLIFRIDKVIRQSFFDTRSKIFTDMEFESINDNVTHWQPLPNPPQK